MKIQKATRRYDNWLRKQCDVVKADLDRKHALMSLNLFTFIRGTFYRWVQQFPEVCPRLAEAPKVPAVGDLHVENFGLWRDAEGRLVWGVNDFDEAAPLPYTNDLVRLASSALVAAREARLQLRHADTCAAVLRGYRHGLERGGRPFVLEREHHWLRHAALFARRSSVEFWKSMQRLPTARTVLSTSARKALAAAMPDTDHVRWLVKQRTAGVGSLGRPRWVAILDWRGGLIAHEAKARVPSAVLWAADSRRTPDYSTQVVERSVRAPDPYLQFRRRWIVRRLAPDCGRLELADLAGDRDERRLLEAMGWEAANIHLGDPRAAAQALRHVRKLDRTWLRQAAEDMAGALTNDWRKWRARRSS